jgi:hypothetical protein
MALGRFELRSWLLRLLAAALGAQLACAPAAAQTQRVILNPEYDALFGQVLREPANLDLSFRFAEVATAAGDYEAAIGALERMLFYNPDLPRVRLELGILYFRLGSYEMARSYFASALAAPGVPADVRARVEPFLFEIERRLNTTQWSVFGQLGARFQTNANAGPTSALVRGAGLDVILDRRFVKQPDWNLFGVAAVRHIHDFENQRGDVWETNLVGYAARQFKIERLDLALAEIQTGPRFALMPDLWVGSSIRPYVLANAVTLGNSSYLTTVGAGVSLGLPLPGGVLIEPFFEERARRFESTQQYPLANQQTGHLSTAGVLMQGPVWGSVRWQARAAYVRNDARADFNAYDQVAFDIGFPVEFAGLWAGARPWLVVPTTGFSVANYDQPNLIIDPFVRRRDREWRAGAALDIPVWQQVGIGVAVQYAVTDSNLRNYETNNLSVVFGPTVRF